MAAVAPAASAADMAAFAERLSAVEQLLRRQSAEAGHLASHLAGLHAETQRLEAEFDASAGGRASRPREGSTASRLQESSVPCEDLPGMPRDESLPAVLDLEQPGVLVDRGMSKLMPAYPASTWQPATEDSLASLPIPSLRRLNALGTFTLSRSNTARIFADAEELKEEIRKNLTEEQHDITQHYHSTGWCQHIARNHLFESLSLVVIILNAAWIAVEIDLNHTDFLFEAEPGFQVAAHLFCVFFVLELLVRIMAFRSKRRALREAWLVFDAILVFLIVFETWVVSLVIVSTGSTPGTSNLRAFAVFRTLRLLRVLRLARVLRELPELLVIVRAIVIALRAISIVLVLLGLIIYMGAIVFRVLLEDTDLGAQRFGSVPSALETLLLEVALSGTRGGPLIRKATSEHAVYGLLLLLFVLISNVTVMGVLGGLLVQTVKTVAEVEKEENQVKRVARTIDELWARLIEHGVEHTDSISEKQLKKLLAERSTAKVLNGIGVDLEALVNASGFTFELHEGKLGKPEFKRMVLDQRRHLSAKVKDHVETRRFIDTMFKRNGQRSSPGDTAASACEQDILFRSSGVLLQGEVQPLTQ